MVAVRVNIKIRKYLWSEFVRDVIYVFYATSMISDVLFKRYFKRSIPDMLQSAKSLLISAVLFLALLFAGIAGLAFTVGIPITLVLAGLGFIH